MNLKIPASNTKHSNAESELARLAELSARRDAAVARSASSSTSLYVDRALGATLVGVDGAQIIDFGSGIAVNSVGHSAAAVVEAIRDQAEKFTHTCFMVAPYSGYVEVCERLNELVPIDGEKRTALFSTGAEAVESAVKIARVATGRTGIAAFDLAYHGRTNLTLALTSSNLPYKQGFGPFAPDVHRLPMAHPYRWPSGAVKAADEAAALAIERIETQIGPENLAALIVEPIQGEGGFIVPAPGFLSAVAEYAQSRGILVIADEIQSGLCRTGDWFAFEHEGFVPDIVVTAKGLAAGMPLSAVTGREAVMNSVHEGGLGGTYSGNPVACAAALAALKLMEQDDLAARARWIESVMRPGLDAIAARHTAVGDVRGRGAMLALELVRSATDQTPDSQAAVAVQQACLDAGLLVLICGAYKNVLRLLPPLTIEEDELTEGMRILAGAFAAVLPTSSAH